MRERRLHRGEDRARVEVEHRVVVVVRNIGEGEAAEHQPGVVDEPVEPAERIGRVVDDPARGLRIGYVAVDENRDSACIGDPFDHRFRGLLARIVVDRDLRALRRERCGKRRADARRCSCDEHRLAGEVGNNETRCCGHGIARGNSRREERAFMRWTDSGVQLGRLPEAPGMPGTQAASWRSS